MSKIHSARSLQRMIKLKAAGGVVVRKIKESDQKAWEALLIRRNDVWDLPKGKLEDDESIEECAIREVEEETGVKPLELNQFLCTTVHTYRERGESVEKTTYWYLMSANGEEAYRKMSPQTEEGITSLRWEPLESALELVHYENLKQVMQKVLE